MDIMDEVLQTQSISSAMPFSDDSASAADPKNAPQPTPTWNYPSRMCRICLEEVVPTVTFYPPGIPPAFQRPQVEYVSEEDYGRLIKPCKCRGGMRYIHEHCLLRLRTESQRPGSLWKCHQCGHQFNFKRLTFQRYLGSKLSSGVLAVVFMLFIMFLLGFVADPLINLYMDPYDTILGNEEIWREVDVNAANDNASGWALHFVKGMISMGLVGFIKTALLNPFQWWNLRTIGWSSGRSSGTSTTGRERTVNISWIAVIIGISSAFYFFYQWTQTIIGKTLQRIGNNIVDTQLAGDDDDLKVPPGFKHDSPSEPVQPAEKDASQSKDDKAIPLTPEAVSTRVTPAETTPAAAEGLRRSQRLKAAAVGNVPEASEPESAPTRLEERPEESDAAYSSALDSARDQGWSFIDIPK